MDSISLYFLFFHEKKKKTSVLVASLFYFLHFMSVTLLLGEGKAVLWYYLSNQCEERIKNNGEK